MEHNDGNKSKTGELVEIKKTAAAVSREDNGIRLVARGTDSLADEIIRTARDCDIPVIENFRLGNELDKLPVGDYVPDKVFFALAQLLEYIYALDDQDTGSAR